MGRAVDPALGMSLLVFLGVDVFGELVALFPSALSLTKLQPLPITVSRSPGSLCNNGLKLVEGVVSIDLAVTLLSCDHGVFGINNFYRIFVKSSKMSHSCFLYQGIVTSLEG